MLSFLIMQKAVIAGLAILAACWCPLARAASETDFSKYKTADALWSHLEDELHRSGDLNSDDEASVLFTGVVAGLGDFVQRFPDDKRAVTARVSKAQFEILLLQLGTPAASPEQIAKELRGVIAAPAIPAEDRQMARLLLVNLFALAGPSEKFVEEAESYGRDFPRQPLSPGLQLMLISQLLSSDPARADKLIAEAVKSDDPTLSGMARDFQRWSKMLGKPFDLKFTAVDGREVDTAKMRGKVILIDFWATWCRPCVQTIPEVVGLYKKYHDKGFDVAGISLDQDKGALLAMTKSKGMTWPQYFDGLGFDNKISSSYGITSIPQMWLVDKKGNLVNINARVDLEKNVEKLLAE